MEVTWCHRETCIETKQSVEDGVSVWWPDKKLDDLTSRGYLGCRLNGRAVFWSFAMRLYI